MGTAPPSKPLKSNHYHHHPNKQSHPWGVTNPTDPFHKRGERPRRYCVQSALFLPRRVARHANNINNKNKKNKHTPTYKMTVLMKLILLRDWQRVLIRAGLFGDEVSQVCTVPLYRPVNTTTDHDNDSDGGDDGDIDQHGSPSSILYCQVLPLHVACALQPPPQVVEVLLLLVRRPPSTRKVLLPPSSFKNENKRVQRQHFPQNEQFNGDDDDDGLNNDDDDVNECNDVVDADQDQDHPDHPSVSVTTAVMTITSTALSTSLATVPIQRLGSSGSSRSGNKSGRHPHDKPRRLWKAFVLRHRHDANQNNNNNNNEYNGMDEQRDQEEGCRLLDENANHHFHFERERVHLEQQLATNGGGSSSAASSSVASFPSPSSSSPASVWLDGSWPPKSRPSRGRGVSRHLLGLRKSHYLLDTSDSCVVSLEASIGDGETDGDHDVDDNGIDDEDRCDQDTLLMEDLPKKDSNESDLPLDGWSSYSSIQFVDEDDDEDDDDGDEGFEYFDAYEADYTANVDDDDGLMANGRDDSLLNQFLDQQGIVLQLTPGGEIQPMPIQEARQATLAQNGKMESESVDVDSSGFLSVFSPYASDSHASDPLGDVMTAKKTTALVVTPLALWKSLQLGEDQVLPIHIACLYNASASVVHTLLKEYPEGALVGVLGLLPIHLSAMAIALPELPFASSGGSSNVYSLVKSQLAPTNPDYEDSNDDVLMTERLKVLVDVAPECLFAKSVAHGMRPVEYAHHLANERHDGRVTSQRSRHQLAVQFLEETEKARLRVQPSTVDEVSIPSNSNSYTFTMPMDVESAQKKSVKCNRTQSSSTCTTAASSSHGAVTMMERHPILKASSSSSSSSPPGTTGLSEMLQHGMWSEAMELLEGDLRLAKKWHYGIDHHKNGAKATGQETTCTLWKRLPLHIACASIEAPPIGLLDLLLKAYRGAASCADPHSGYLPLHLACQTHCNLAVIRTLLDVAPCTTKAVDGVLGRLPLHHAIVARAPYSVVEVLVHHDPRAVSTPDQKGKTPLMLAQCAYLTRKSGESSHGYPRHHPVLSLLELARM